MSRSDLVDVTMTLHIETANAIRVSDDGDNEKGVWLPKSQIEFTPPNAKKITEVTMPTWLAKEKGLI